MLGATCRSLSAFGLNCVIIIATCLNHALKRRHTHSAVQEDTTRMSACGASRAALAAERTQHLLLQGTLAQWTRNAHASCSVLQGRRLAGEPKRMQNAASWHGPMLTNRS